MAQVFSFPTLSEADLLSCLRDMELPLTAAQLAKPAPEFIVPLYETFVTTLGGVSRQEMQQPIFAAIDVLEYPELHDESIPFFAFFRHLSRLFAAAGVKDFTLQDVCKPEAPRLRRHLSAIVNFTRYREDKLASYIDAQDQLADVVDEATKASADRDELRQELQQLTDERSAQQPAVLEAQQRHQELYAENKQLNRRQQGLHDEVAAAKEESHKLEEQLSQGSLRLKQAKLEGAQLQAQVVESPERLQKRIEELNELVARERQLVSAAEQRMRDVQARLDSIARVEKEVQKAMRTMGELETEIGHKKEASRKAKGLQAQLASVQQEGQEVDAQLRSLRAKQERLTLWTSQHEHQSQLRQEAALSQIEEQHKEREAVEAANAAHLAKLAENDAMVRSLTNKLQTMEAKHAAGVAAICSKFEGLVAQAREHDGKVAAKLGFTIPAHHGGQAG